MGRYITVGVVVGAVLAAPGTPFIVVDAAKAAPTPPTVSLPANDAPEVVFFRYTTP